MARINPKGERRGPARSFLGALDTYVKPERDVSGAQALQQGLGQLGNALGTASRKLKKEQDEAHYQQGKADYLRQAAGQEPQGIKQGTLFRSQSKFYQMGLAEAQGEAKAIDWANGLTTAYKKWDGRGSSDPDVFRSWMNEQSAEFLNGMGEDTHALNAAMPYINRANQNMAKHHVTYRDGQMKIARFNAFNTKIANTMDLFETSSITGEDMAGVFENQIQLMIGSGENGAEVINSIITQATQHANAYDNPEILKAIAKLHDDGKFRLSKANQAQIADANDKVENDILRRNRIDTAAAKDASDRAEAELMGNWASTLSENMRADLPDVNTVSPDTYKDMVLLQDAVIKSKTRISSEQEAANAIAMDAILNDPALSDKEKVNAIVSYGKDNPVKDISDYIKEANAEADPDAIHNSKTFKEYKSAFLKSINAGSNQALSFMGDDDALTAAVRINFDNYVRAYGGNVDKNDAAALNSFMKEAKIYSLERAYEVSPEAFDTIDNPLIRKTLGLDAIAAGVDAERAEAAAEATRIKNEADAKLFQEDLASSLMQSSITADGTAGTFETPEEPEVITPEEPEVKAVVEEKADPVSSVPQEDNEFQKGNDEFVPQAYKGQKIQEAFGKNPVIKRVINKVIEKTDLPEEEAVTKVSKDIYNIFSKIPPRTPKSKRFDWVLKQFNKKYPELGDDLTDDDIEFLISNLTN